jgi:hypothetical protein
MFNEKIGVKKSRKTVPLRGRERNQSADCLSSDIDMVLQQPECEAK